MWEASAISWNFKPGSGGEWMEKEGGPGTERGTLPCKGAWEGKRVICRESEGLARGTQ